MHSLPNRRRSSQQLEYLGADIELGVRYALHCVVFSPMLIEVSRFYSGSAFGHAPPDDVEVPEAIDRGFLCLTTVSGEPPLVARLRNTSRGVMNFVHPRMRREAHAQPQRVKTDRSQSINSLGPPGESASGMQSSW